jgi:hypothetical protein
MRANWTAAATSALALALAIAPWTLGTIAGCGPQGPCCERSRPNCSGFYTGRRLADGNCEHYDGGRVTGGGRLRTSADGCRYWDGPFEGPCPYTPPQYDVAEVVDDAADADDGSGAGADADEASGVPGP